jgi:hypothetical protein
MHSIGEIVKQFQFDVPLLSYPIKGKIVKDVYTKGVIRYTWSISHHYKPSAGAGVYFPSVLTSDSLEEWVFEPIYYVGRRSNRVAR